VKINHYAFPSELLKHPLKSRKDYFRDYWVAHRKITEAAAELLGLILEPADAEIINVIGPTGVGKTTLMKYVIKVLYENSLSELEKDPGKIPAAFMTAENPESGSYDWKDHYTNTLIALNEVLIEKKIYLPAPGASEDEIKASLKEKIGGRSALRRAAQSALMNRIIFSFFVDEAQRITKRRSGEGLMNQADTIRSLAYASGVLHVLVGTYDLIPLRNLNGQLGRRSHTVHFSRYQLEGESNSGVKDIESFTEAFLSFQAHLPLAKTSDLTKHLEFCFLRCLGCIGLLKSWFRRSLALALEENSETVNSRLFLKATPPKAVYDQIAEEIKEGEEALENEDSELNAELNKMTVGEESPRRSTSKHVNTDNEKGNIVQGHKKGKKDRQARFKPAPKRYCVGTQENAN
jgi:energy-coupling factor transporter ATP-binding protein EcfA2